MPSYWLFKSEPETFSWEDLVKRGSEGEPWDGVRNYQARNNMQAMKVGDFGFFYHSNEGREVVGVCEVVNEAHPDHTDDTGKWHCVDIKALVAMPNPVSLVEVKAKSKLANLELVKNSRLSVQPVKTSEWTEVCKMGGLDPKSLAPL